ncbi:hypothetical protein STANM337S_05987 [Streptomyces tanashiensis]
MNFAMFRSVFERGDRLGAGPVLRLWRTTLGLFSRWWQIESLYRANAKYRPVREPRFVLFQKSSELPKKIVVRGGASGISGPAYVYLPPEYFRPGHAKKSFPASVVLTGYPGNAKSLIKVLKYPTTAHRPAAQGKTQPMVLMRARPSHPLATPSAWTYPESAGRDVPRPRPAGGGLRRLSGR